MITTLRRPSAEFRFGTAAYMLNQALADWLDDGASIEEAAVTVQAAADQLRATLAKHAAGRRGGVL